MSSFDVDFIIMVGGRDITEFVHSWSLNEVDQGLSTLQIDVSNHDGNQVFNMEDKVYIRFGYVGDLSDMVEMDIHKVEEIFGVDTVRRVVITAYDCTWGLSGKNFWGDAGRDTKEAIENVIKSTGLPLKPDTKNINPTQPSTLGKQSNSSSGKNNFMISSRSVSDAIFYILNNSASV